jgi:uncharacterized membrane protein YcgQ (UPF0703/DUF1980 family)
MEQKITSHIVKGSMIALLLILINIIGQLTGFIYHENYRWIGTTTYVLALIISAIYFSKQHGQQINFGMAFTHGFKTTAVITCLLFIYTLLSVYLLFPQQIDHFVQLGVEEAKRQGKTDAEMKEGMTIARKVLVISFLAGGLMINLITGVLGSLLGAAIAKKNQNFQPKQS